MTQKTQTRNETENTDTLNEAKRNEPEPAGHGTERNETKRKIQNTSKCNTERNGKHATRDRAKRNETEFVRNGDGRETERNGTIRNLELGFGLFRFECSPVYIAGAGCGWPCWARALAHRAWARSSGLGCPTESVCTAYGGFSSPTQSVCPAYVGLSSPTGSVFETVGIRGRCKTERNGIPGHGGGMDTERNGICGHVEKWKRNETEFLGHDW